MDTTGINLPYFVSALLAKTIIICYSLQKYYIMSIIFNIYEIYVEYGSFLTLTCVYTMLYYSVHMQVLYRAYHAGITQGKEEQP